MKNELPWKHIVLADYDEDDCLFFREAVSQCLPSVKLTIENFSADFLKSADFRTTEPIDAVFLEINFPAGWNCLENMVLRPPKGTPAFIIFTTSDTFADIDKAYRLGASMYISKSSSIAGLSRQIAAAHKTILSHRPEQPPRDVFYLSQNL